MSLTAPRFKDDPTLEACLAGTHRMLAPESGPAVQKVQGALIDLGFPLPANGANGAFNSETGNALVAFKTSRRIFPNDPVVGVKTMTALDAECADKPPPPFSERDEWLSWRNRAASHPVIGTFNFTRQDEFNRRNTGGAFNFDSDSNWMPDFIQDALEIGLTMLLDPNGSPVGPNTPPATWGAGPFDLFHFHLALAGGFPLPLPPGLGDGSRSLDKRFVDLRKQSESAPGAEFSNRPWAIAHRANLLSSGVLREARTLIDQTIAAGTPSNPALLVWHTFEKGRWRPAGMQSSSPLRSWQMALAPAPQLFVVPFPFPPEPIDLGVRVILSVSFVVSKTGIITACPGSFFDAYALAGLVPDEVNKVTD